MEIQIFLEVDQLNEPLPLFLGRRDIIDGRFDPGTTVKHVFPEPLGFWNNMIHFHQDPNMKDRVKIREDERTILDVSFESDRIN